MKEVAVRYSGVMRAILVFLLTTGFALAQTNVYKSVGPDGTVTFTDQPRPGAEKLEIREPKTVAPSAGATRALEGARGTPEEASAEAAYTEFAIVSPTDDQAIRANNGNVSVSMSLAPSLHADHAIVVSVNGQKIGKGSSTSLQLQNLPRGTHTVQAAVVDNKGQEVIRTGNVTFHVLRVGVGG